MLYEKYTLKKSIKLSENKIFLFNKEEKLSNNDRFKQFC